jgi:hypothetical protein
MKRIIVAATALVLLLAFVTAYADQLPIMTESREVGTLLNIEAPRHMHEKQFRGDLFYTPQDVISPRAKKDFSGPLVAETPVDVGTALYQSAFETKLAEPGITGMAAGGVAREDETTRIWDNVMGPPGGSDLP